MYILIVGGGKIGFHLAKRLLEAKHTIALIEKDRATCEFIAKELDILVINGDGCEPRFLEEAGIDRADVVVSVTGDDEDNFIVCQLAKERFGVRRTVARVNDPKNEKSFVELGVDVPVDSTMILARVIEEEVTFSDFVNLLSFKRGRLAIVRVDLPQDSPVIDKKVQDLNLPADSVLISLIRGDKVILPKGDTILKVGDDLIALTTIENEQSLLNLLIGKI
jgi:trk system potassium uptake protein TrkA